MHSAQPTLSSEVAVVWRAALADAGFEPTDALLFLLPGPRSSDGYSGWHGPACFGMRNADDLPREIVGMLDEVDDECRIGAHRIFVWQERGSEGLAAVIRHEFEHARQHEAFGMPLLELAGLAYRVIAIRVGGLAGGGFLYQAIPTEMDANAAAAIFVRGRFGDEWIDELLRQGDEDGAAFRSKVGPAALETLPDRMLRFLASVQDLCERYAEREGFPFGQLLDSLWPDAGDAWRRLVEDEELRLDTD